MTQINQSRLPDAIEAPPDCVGCPIRERAVCSRCEPDELNALNGIKYYTTFAAGQTIALRGDAADAVMSIVTGTATLERSIEDGRTQMVGLLLPSDFVGRPGRATLDYDVTAVTDVLLCCFKRKPFEEILAETPHLRERLLEMALDELDAARDWMLLLGRKTAREKITSFMMLLIKRTTLPSSGAPAGSHRVQIPISREAMANFLGLTIETVSRQISALKSDGVITLDGNRTLLIPDIDALMLETGDDDDGGIVA